MRLQLWISDVASDDDLQDHSVFYAARHLTPSALDPSLGLCLLLSRARQSTDLAPYSSAWRVPSLHLVAAFWCPSSHKSCIWYWSRCPDSPTSYHMFHQCDIHADSGLETVPTSNRRS